MGAVSRIVDVKPRGRTPTLVLADLHADAAVSASAPARETMLHALENCRMALSCARQNGMQVAFVRHARPSRSFLASRACPSWFGDIRPARSDMIFDRELPSCYASSEFAQMSHRGGEFVLAGLFGETSCLATLMDGYSRSHVFTFLHDASASRGHCGVAAEEMHRAVTGIASFYSEITSTEAWITRMSRELVAAIR